jgi:hypothetical protein
VVELLLCKHEALSSNPIPQKKKGRKERRKEDMHLQINGMKYKIQTQALNMWNTIYISKK